MIFYPSSLVLTVLPVVQYVPINSTGNSTQIYTTQVYELNWYINVVVVALT